MANSLFGLDIASIVDSSIASAGGVLPGTLLRSVPGSRATGNLSGGNNPTTESYAFRGFAETTGSRRSGSTTASVMSTVSILGASVPVVPAVNDEAQLEGKTWTLLELVERDPAGALYVFRAEER